MNVICQGFGGLAVAAVQVVGGVEVVGRVVIRGVVVVSLVLGSGYGSDGL